MDKKMILEHVRTELKESVTQKTKMGFQRYFKEKVKFYGVSLQTVDKIAKKHFQSLKGFSKNEVFNLCEELLKTNYSEESWIAANWSYWINKDYTPSDFSIFEKWVNKYVTNWATCDTLCNHTIGTFIEKYPEFIKKLITWTKSENRWVKRASSVTLILPARHGLFLKEIFEIANNLLLDPDDLVQKGYGWMLKEASKSHQKEVFEYVMSKKKIMPRTALRYAIEKLPDSLRKKAMEK